MEIYNIHQYLDDDDEIRSYFIVSQEHLFSGIYETLIICLNFPVQFW